MYEVTTDTGLRCVVVDEMESLERMVRWIGAKQNAGSLIGFDTETTSRRAELAELVGMSWAASREGGFYIPLGHTFGDQLELDLVLSRVRDLLAGPGITMAGAKFDIRVMRKYGVEVKLGADANSITRLLGHVEYGVGVKPSVKRMYGEEVTEFTDVVGKGQTFAEVEITEAAKYAVPDAVNAYRLAMDGLEMLPEKTKQLLVDIEHSVMDKAAEMEDHGLPIDIEFVRQQIELGRIAETHLYEAAIRALQALASRKNRQLPPGEINLNSSTQLREILFDICELPVVKKTKPSKTHPQGQPSADAGALEKLAKKFGPVDRIAQYRSAGTVIGRLEEFIDYGQEERSWWFARGSLNPTGAATGRWSGSNPNTQNIPKEKYEFDTPEMSWHFKIRDAICAPEGFWICSADYSQIELRVAAGLSKCVRWLEAYEENADIHTVTASAAMGIPMDRVTSSQRQMGKTLNFSMLFGAQAGNVAAQLGITKDAAQKLIDGFWHGLPEVNSWANSVKAFTKTKGYSETYFGRRRYFSEMEITDPKKKWLIEKALREAVNHPIQGTAADILKIALHRQRGKEAELGAGSFMVVHDQIVWMVPEEVTPGRFAREMETAVVFPITGFPEIPIAFSIGKRLGSLVEFDRAEMVPETLGEIEEVARDQKAVATSITIAVDRSVTKTEMAELAALLKSRPGDSEVVLHCKQGNFTLPVRTDLTADNELEVRAVVKGAWVL